MKQLFNTPFHVDQYGVVTMTLGDFIACIATIALLFTIAFVWVRLKKEPGFKSSKS